MNTLPIDNSTVLRHDLFKFGFTQSELSTMDDCAEKWYLGYNHLLERVGTFAWHFVYGDAFHRYLSEWYRGGEMPTWDAIEFNYPPGVILDGVQQLEEHKWKGVCAMSLERYAKFYEKDRDEWNILVNEEILETIFEGIKFTGKIDLAFELQGCIFLLDTKTSSQFNPMIYEGWQFKFQFMFYMWLFERAIKNFPKYFLVNAARKPGIRVTKNESIEGYVQRWRQILVQEPEKYFVRMRLPRLKGSMEHFEERVLRPKWGKLKLLTEPTTSVTTVESLVRNQNTNHCVRPGSICPFRLICMNGFEREGFQYTARQNKHQELSDSNEES